jgi:endonuclease/exonuclease/phosphatase family metal-dependent hydrolase
VKKSRLYWGFQKRGVVLGIIAAIISTHPVSAQVLMSGGTYSQNFDSLAGSGTGNAWTDNVTLPGWYAATNVTSVKSGSVTLYNAGTGSSTAGALYSFGGSSSTERALGSLASGTPGNFAYGVRFTNDTTSAQTNFIISYTGEQWRVASVNVQTLAFSYRLSYAAITNADAAGTQSWTAFSALDFSSPNTNATQALNGNDPTNRVVFTNVVLSGAVVQPGQEIFFRWYDPDDSGSDDGLAIDNLTVSFSATAAGTNTPPAATNGTLVLMTYNVKGNGATDWSTNAPQVQAIGRELMYLNPDIITFNEIPRTNMWQMTNWVTAFLPGYYLATNSIGDGFIQSCIASRFPILSSASHLHASNLDPFGYTNSNFTRDLFEAQISVPDFSQPLHVFIAHLKATTTSPQDDADKRAAEASAVSNYFVTVFLPGTNGLHPYVLDGDMNEDAFFPETNNYTSGHPIQRMTSPPTGLQLATPVNPYTPAPTNAWTESIQASHLTTRFDYILPCGLLCSNMAGSQVFRTDLLSPLPPNLNGNDDKTASDHLPVLMVFNNPYLNPFRLVSITRSNQYLSATWEAVPGQSYRVENSSNLTSWTTFADNLLATNSSFTFNTNTPANPQFFRVRRLN